MQAGSARAGGSRAAPSGAFRMAPGRWTAGVRPRGSSLSFRRPAVAPSDPIRNNVGHRACEDLETQGACHCAPNELEAGARLLTVPRRRNPALLPKLRVREGRPAHFTPAPGPWNGSPGALKNCGRGSTGATGGWIGGRRRERRCGSHTGVGAAAGTSGTTAPTARRPAKTGISSLPPARRPGRRGRPRSLQHPSRGASAEGSGTRGKWAGGTGFP